MNNIWYKASHLSLVTYVCCTWPIEKKCEIVATNIKLCIGAKKLIRVGPALVVYILVTPVVTKHKIISIH